MIPTLTMLSKFSQWLAPPDFDNEEKTQLAGLQNVIFLGAIAIAVAFGLLSLVMEPESRPRLVITGLWVPAAIGGLLLMHRGYVRQAGMLFSALAWLILTLGTWLSGGVISANFCSYTVIILVIGTLCGLRLALIFAGLSFASGLGTLYAEATGVLPPPLMSPTPVSMLAALTTNFIAAAVLLYLATRTISNALDRARDKEAALLISNHKLQEAQAVLEERTAELTTAIEILENQLTERKQTLAALAQSEEALRQLSAELEQRVQARTEELAKTNEALTQEIAVRRQAEETLKDTFSLIEQVKQEWEATVDSLPQFICLLDRQGFIKRANRTTERWNLAPVTEVKGHGLHELFHPGCTDPNCYLTSFWNQAGEKLGQGRPSQCEANDEILGRYLHYQVQPMSIVPNGRPQLSDTSGVMVVQDITERKRMEEVLRQSEESYRLLFENNPHPLFVYDLETLAFLAVNDAAIHHYGYTRAEFLAMTIKDIRPPQDIPALLKKIAEVQDGIDEAGIWRHIKKGGTVMYVEITSHILNFGGRNADLVLAHDVTDRLKVEAELTRYRDHLEYLVNERTAQLRQANQQLQQEMAEHQRTATALQQSEENFRALAHNAQDGFLIITGAEKIVYVNRRACELTGYSSDKLLNFSIKDLVSAADYEKVSRRYHQRIAGEVVTSQYEVEFVHHSGRPIPIEITAARTVWYGQPADIISFRDITERIRAAEILRQERDFARTLIDTAQVIILVLDPQGRIDLFNPYLETISGYRLEEVQGQDWFSTFLPELNQDRIRNLFLQALDDIQTRGNINSIVTKDGRERQIEWYDKTLKDVQGRTIGLLAVGQDITARLEMEQALRQAEERYRTLFEQAPAMYLITFNQGGIPIVTDCNNLFLRTLNYDRSEVIGRPLTDFYAPVSQARLIENGGYQRALAGTFTAEERQLITRDGRPIDTLLRAEPELDAAGDVFGTRAMYLDITERKQVEQALRDSEERFRRVITSISDHIYVTEVTERGEHVNLYISPNVELLTGYPAERILKGWTFWGDTVIHPDDRTAAAKQLVKLDQGQPSEVEYRLIRADGDVIWVRDSARVGKRSDGSQIIYGVVSDITTRKEAAEVILRYSERLEILRDIEQGILSAQSVEAIGQAVVSRIHRLIPGNRATIRMINLATNEAVLIAGTDETVGWLNTGDSIRLDQFGDPSEWVNFLKEGRVLMLGEDQLKHPNYELFQVKTNRSVMIAPAIYRDQLIGALTVSATESDAFTEEHQDIARQLAVQLAIAIGQADLYRQIQRHAEELEQRVSDRTRELSTLYEVTAVASETIDLQPMLARSLQQVLNAMRCQVGVIHLMAESNGEERTVTQQGLTPEAMAQVETLLQDNQLIDRVVEGGKPVMIPDLTNDPRLTRATAPTGLHSYAGAPIRAGGQILGVLNIFGRLEQQFNIEELALLASTGDQIGVAVENFRLRQQAEQAAVMEERQRLARELHDSVTQSLYSLTLFSEGSLELAKNGALELVEHNLTRMGETAQQALKEMRLLVYELRPVDLEKEGLVGALHQRLAAVEKRTGVDVRLVAEELIELPAPLEKELYRIAVEALNNVLKHAQATFVTLYLRVVNEQLELELVDNGIGFEPDLIGEKGGLGLVSMRERAEQIGASLSIRSAPGQGTAVKVTVRSDKL